VTSEIEPLTDEHESAVPLNVHTFHLKG